METTKLRPEEAVGLGIAALLHVALLAALLFQPEPAPPPPLPERVTVSLAEDVGLVAASPDPVAESRAATAPELAPIPALQPDPVVAAPPRPAPRPVATTAPRPRATPTRAAPPRPRQTQTPPRTSNDPRRRPDRTTSRTAPPRPAGGNRIGEDFLPPGAGTSTTSSETRAPASVFGATEQAALQQAITRQLRPHWRTPQGVDTEKLVTIISWRLNRDGTLAGRPTVVSQTGINDANRAQAPIHAEAAIRSVQLAAPFELPDQFYSKWSNLRWTFDRRL